MNSVFGGAMQSLVKTKAAESSGVGSTLKNIEAVAHVSGMIKTSYGPRGTYKLLVNSRSQPMLSRSCAAILNECDIEHPAVKMLIPPLSHLSMLGDSTGFMLILVGEILQMCVPMLTQGVGPTDIAAALRESADDVLECMRDAEVSAPFSIKDMRSLEMALSGIVREKRLFELLARSIASISDSRTVSLESMRVTKVNVGSVEDSEAFTGLLLEKCPEGVARSIRNGKVAIYNCPIAPSSMETKGTVLFTSAEELLSFGRDDEEGVRKMVDEITSNGVDMLVCNGSVDRLMLDYLNAKGIVVLNLPSKYDLRRVWILTGGAVSNSFRRIDEHSLGSCNLVEVEDHGGRKYTRIVGPGKMASIVVKDSLPERLSEYEALIAKGVSAVRLCAMEASRSGGKVGLLRGGGVCEKEIYDRVVERSKAYTDVRKRALVVVGEALLALSRGVSELGTKEIYDVSEIKRRAVEYGIASAADILSVTQMFISKEADPIGAPKRQGHWDEQD